MSEARILAVKWIDIPGLTDDEANDWDYYELEQDKWNWDSIEKILKDMDVKRKYVEKMPEDYDPILYDGEHPNFPADLARACFGLDVTYGPNCRRSIFRKKSGEESQSQEEESESRE